MRPCHNPRAREGQPEATRAGDGLQRPILDYEEGRLWTLGATGKDSGVMK